MKLSNFYIPYPVLGINGSFEGKSFANCKSFTFETTHDKFVFNLDLELKDRTIEQLIIDGKAAFSCEVDCVKTYFKNIWKGKYSKSQFEILRTDLVGKVDFFFSVVAVEPIENYINPNFNQKYYGGYNFNLQKGDLLAYFGEWTFNADVKFDELKALGSIVEVKEDRFKQYTHYELGGDKIAIYLPTSEFLNFKSSNINQFANITHASIVQCALVCALHAYKANEGTTWAETLKFRVKQDKKLNSFEDLANLDEVQIQELVSLLLNNPNKRMFETINTIRTSNN